VACLLLIIPKSIEVFSTNNPLAVSVVAGTERLDKGSLADITHLAGLIEKNGIIAHINWSFGGYSFSRAAARIVYLSAVL